jgi:integrase
VALAFRGRRLDEITRVDIRQYYLDRTQAAGPFRKRSKVSVRSPEVEIASLSAVYTWLHDTGTMVDNPCHRPKTRKKDSPLRTYRRKHVPVIPTREQLRSLFAAAPKGKDKRALVRPAHRALFMLCYYTAARPESEPCRLLHGDVVLGNEGEWGTVTYRNAKNEHSNRTLPLHPDAAAALKGAMRPQPSRFEGEAALIAWREQPIFRKRGSGKTWDRGSYGNAWAAAVRCVPALAGMWLRDLRPTAKTMMVDAKAPRETVNKILGHADTVADGYYHADLAAMRAAIGTLTLNLDAAMAAGQDGFSGHSASA